MTTDSTTSDETRIEADPDVPVIHIVREFDAPPTKVFRAHVDPALIVRWLGPSRYEMRLDRWDCQTGGAWRYLHVDGDEEHAFHGSFHQVRSPDRIVQTFTWEATPGSVCLETLTLGPIDDGRRTRLTTSSLFESFEARDAMLASGMESGVVEGYQRLDAILARA
jgi:uncharacterized protein YndB with AHSA1/START domain